MDFFKRNRRKFLLYAIDMGAYAAIFVGASLGGYFSEGAINISKHILSFLVFFAAITVSRLVFTIYSNVWRYANCRAYIEMVCADAVAAGVGLLATVLTEKYTHIGLWKALATVVVFSLVTLCMRFLYQELYRTSSRDKDSSAGIKKKVAVLGAGRIGALLAEELQCYTGSLYEPVFFIDTDKNKVGSRMIGLPVVEEGKEALNKIKEYGVSEIIVTIPKMGIEKARQIFDYYGKSGCKIKVYDYPANSSSDDGKKRTVRDIKIEDLLFRDALKPMSDEARGYYSDKVVLVTGGGGSIGSELCRQIAKCKPKKLVILDIYENNAYDIQQELVGKYGESLSLAVEIGSVRDRQRLDAIFALHRPNVVFHAAAHKHVPLMETSNGEAVKNNVFGTQNTADAAEKYGVEKFILISTDKAVNPTNVMGATKRMCEMIVHCRKDSRTSFCAVRFGNVLGSNGSVIPLFRRQIAEGGPVTVTDKRIVRYFMTIPEATELVMQAGAMAERGELFVLDMGKPVKIIDLAVNMIKFSGFEPYKDIAIEEIGLRPGEKLYEELLVDKERMQKTENNLIFIENEELLSRECVEQKLCVLRDAVERFDADPTSDDIRDALMEAVPTFCDPEKINSLAEQSEEMLNTNAMAGV